MQGMQVNGYGYRAVFSAMVALLCGGPSIIATGAATGVATGLYDPPPSYYNSATGIGATLRNQLQNIIENHTVLSYNKARSILQITDQDPNDPERMILAYDRISLNVSAINPLGSIPGWDGGATWNREHTWPRSRGVGSSGPDYSDLHQLRPTTSSVNSSRSNLNFGGVYGAQEFGRVVDKGAVVWYPGDADAGMIARQQFYMAVRYGNSDSATDDLEVAVGNPNTGLDLIGDKDRMIEWHYEAVPDDFELRRNDIIYDSYQFNRNPFVDRPEYVWSVFVDQQNDSRIAIGGATVGGNGGSTSQVSLGRVLVGAAVPAAQTVTLNKSGNDGTYFSVATSAAATSSVTGRYNAFQTGGTDSTTFEVGLNASTSTAGLRSGSITIDNLDITTGGGTGRGANDVDDLIDISLDVLDSANPSFAGDSDLHFLTYDFGSIILDSATPTLDFDLFNLENLAGFTADLDLDTILGSGDTSVLTTDLGLFGGASSLEAGWSTSFSASLDTSTAGDFSAIYTLNFSDEDLPGASELGQLTLALMGTVEETAIETADLDGDQDVDGADFLLWQRSFSTLDADDLADWESNYDFSASEQVFAVPEPSPVVLIGLASVGLPWIRTRSFDPYS